MGEVQVVCADFGVKLWKTHYEHYFFYVTYIFLQKYLEHIFYFIDNIKKCCFDIHFNAIMSKVLPRCYPASPSLLVLLLLEDHLRAGEVQMGCGPQSGAAAVRIPISFRSPGCTDCEGQRVLCLVRSLSLSFQAHGAAPFRTISRTIVLYYTP